MAPTHRAARRNRRRMWRLGLRLDPKEAAAAAAAAATEASCSRHRRHATVSSAFLRSPPVGARLRARRCTGPMPPASGPVAFQASEPRAERGARRRRPSDARSAERGVPLASAFIRCCCCCCCCCCCRPGCVSSVRATRGARSVVRGGGARATRGARSDGSYAEYSTSVSVAASSCALLATVVRRARPRVW
jgi:hypothetical protein